MLEQRRSLAERWRCERTDGIVRFVGAGVDQWFQQWFLERGGDQQRVWYVQWKQVRIERCRIGVE